MANIFEESMARMAGRKSRTVKESADVKKISPKNIRLESKRIFETEDLDTLETQFDVSPEEAEANDSELVLVVDPSISADEEIPEEAAEDMVGDTVYKCPICGSNYLCDCDSLEEDIVDGEPTACPVCGEEGEQILVGEIAPIEDAGEETSVDPEEVSDEDEEAYDDAIDSEEEEEEVPTEDDDDEIVEESLDIEDDVIEDEEPEELVLDPIIEIAEEPEDATTEVEAADASVVITNSEVALTIDDSKFESFMNKVVKENYHGDPKFKITRVNANGSTLRVGYVVQEGKKLTKGVLVGEGFKRDARTMTIKFRDKGCFTESMSKEPCFVFECFKLRGTITPVRMSYDYKVKVNESMYRVYGKVSGK